MTGTTSMRPKKGALSATILVGIIIATISIIILVFAFKGIYSTSGTTLTDSICNLNVVIKDAFGGMPLIACSEGKVTVKADNWGACDPDETKGWEKAYKKAGNEEKNAFLRKCTTYQVYDLAHACWSRYGSGDIDVKEGFPDSASLPCYKLEVKGLAEDDYFIDHHVEETLGGIGRKIYADFREENVGFTKSIRFIKISTARGISEDSGNGEYHLLYESYTDEYRVYLTKET